MSPLPKTATAPFCPSEVRGSVFIPAGASSWKKWLLIWGPGLLVSIGYIDPGNWATDIAAGTKYGYDLLFVVLLSSLAAIFLQAISARVGIVTGKDIASLSREFFPRRLNIAFWLFAEVAIVACDIAEVLGAGLAFHLLLGCSLAVGILITILDTVIVLGLQGRGFRQIEAIILGLFLTVGICLGFELYLAGPHWLEVARHLAPSIKALHGPERLYLAVGIIGATVMPHNLYLHSSIVQTRKFAAGKNTEKEIVRLNVVDTVLALSVAFLINAAILILAASAFYESDIGLHVNGIEDAYKLLAPALGSTAAMYAFGIALLASGQSATFTGTIAGQVILEGYMKLQIPCWARRIITRGLALIPALGGVLLMGDGALNKLMVLSQVVLGLQLPFVIYPLLRFAGSRKLMGSFASGYFEAGCAWLLFALITGCNIWLLVQII